MTSLLQIQFQGLNEGEDPKNLPPGTLLRAENQQMDKGRRLVKRHGTTGLVKTALSGSNPAIGKRLLTAGDEAVGDETAITDGQMVWTYAEALGKWSPIDRIPCWRVTKRPLVESTRSVLAVDIGIYGDMLVALYIAQGLLFYEVSDRVTGAVIVPATVTNLGGAHYPRVLVSGTNAYLIAALDVGNVTCRVLDMTTLTLGSNHVLVNDANATPKPIDAVIGLPFAGVPTLYLAYEVNAGTNRMRIASFTVSTLLTTGATPLDSLGTNIRCACLTFGATAQQVTLAYSSTTSASTKITSCRPDLTSQVGPDVLYAGSADYVFVVENDVTNVLAGWTRDDGNGTDADRLTTALYSVAAHVIVMSSRRITFGLYNPTKPWLTAGRWYVGALTWVHPYDVTITDPIAQPSTVVVEIETADSLTGVQDATHPHVATLENQTGWYGTGLAQTQPTVDLTGAVWLASPYRNREPDNYESQIPLGWNVYTLMAAAGDTFQGAPLGGGSLCAGGAPAWFDGARTMPYGFAHAPQIISVSPVAGGAMVAGVYSYVATYAWRDANGVLHRSTPSAPKTGTTAAGNLSLVVKVATSSLSAKQRTLTGANAANPILIELWRTTIGGTGSHYRLTLEPTLQVLFNDPRAGDVSLTDTKADANIASGSPAVALAAQQQLYTDTGELENVPPPSFVTCTTHRGRLVGIGPDLRTVWLSKDSTIDVTVAPGFHEALTLAFAHDKSSLASLDTVLVVLGIDNIDVVQGDGPDDKGDANTWQIQPIQTDVGCVSPQSVVTSPMGVCFQSRRGIELLDRSLAVSWIGKPVQATLVQFPTITSGVLVAQQGELRWTCDNGLTGIVLAYDYINKIWFTRRYTDASDTMAASIRFVDAALVNGVYTLLTAAGQVYRESMTSNLDGGTTYVATDTLLAPISAQPGRSGWSNDNLAWQRAKDLTLMGTSVSLHDLTVSFAQDYAGTFSQTHTFHANDANTPTAVGPLEKARVTIAVQKCQAVQIRIQDQAPTGGALGTGAGVILESLALRVGAKDGPAKTSAGQQG